MIYTINLLYKITILEMSGFIDKLKALKEKLQDFLPDLNPQESNKKQLDAQQLQQF